MSQISAITLLYYYFITRYEVNYSNHQKCTNMSLVNTLLRIWSRSGKARFMSFFQCFLLYSTYPVYNLSYPNAQGMVTSHDERIVLRLKHLVEALQQPWS